MFMIIKHGEAKSFKMTLDPWIFPVWLPCMVPLQTCQIHHPFEWKVLVCILCICHVPVKRGDTFV